VEVVPADSVAAVHLAMELDCGGLHPGDIQASRVESVEQALRSALRLREELDRRPEGGRRGKPMSAEQKLRLLQLSDFTRYPEHLYACRARHLPSGIEVDVASSRVWEENRAAAEVKLGLEVRSAGWTCRGRRPPG
jgi:hypothetical protein